MTNFAQRAGRRYIAIKAARQLLAEIEQAGLDDLTALADAGTSIIGTYLDGCSEEKKASVKTELAALFHMGVTADMVLEETTRQMPQLRPILDGNPDYRRSEVQRLEAFAKEK